LFRRETRIVRRVARRRGARTGAVEAHAIQVRVIRGSPFPLVRPRDVQHSLHRIDIDDALGAPRAAGELALQLSRIVIQVVVTPPRTLRPPDEIAARFDVSDVLALARVVLDVLP
jgi:hypothetical protein